jgi:hypothetical protein
MARAPFLVNDQHDAPLGTVHNGTSVLLKTGGAAVESPSDDVEDRPPSVDEGELNVDQAGTGR